MAVAEHWMALSKRPRIIAIGMFFAFASALGQSRYGLSC